MSDNTNILNENVNMEEYSEEMFDSENLITEDGNDVDIEDEIEKPTAEQTPNEQTEHEQKLTKLPLARIKNIMKMDPDLNLTSQEAVFLVAKATELFIGSLARETFAITSKNKKKTMQRKDLDAAIESVDALCFLEGTLD
ncbi:DNA polymerase epsilon subunit 4 [Chrysoperla carnea]|uniref:DNA polymerase epsilon subunit 4 n=1 Tax=Chrysoperla carnea TaxID=189513 RepID=UPI001D07CC25|nr:DNA polymerase epsilon subunit 4 [Chrysoperla carnea]